MVDRPAMLIQGSRDHRRSQVKLRVDTMPETGDRFEYEVGFGLSFQLLSRRFSFCHDGGEGRHWKREEERSRNEHDVIRLRGGEGRRRRERRSVVFIFA